MNKKLVLATVATTTTLLVGACAKVTVREVKANEVQGTATAGTDTSTVTTPEVGATGTETHETTAITEQPTTEA